MTPSPPKLLLDECVPRRLAASFPEAIEVRTAPEMGWGGYGEGERRIESDFHKNFA